ncbi:MAG: energy transducer TonB [Gammaproteobacteria bacterium]|nr:energy transducer TonB [Gammaproteobacteria bacterium]
MTLAQRSAIALAGAMVTAFVVSATGTLPSTAVAEETLPADAQEGIAGDVTTQAPDAQDAAPPDAPPADTRLDQRILADAALQDGRPVDALAASERWLSLLREDADADKEELVEALLLRARVHEALDDHAAAAETYLEVLDVVESLHGRLAPQMIAPMLGLGEQFNAAGQHGQALVVADEARHLARRNHGLFGVEQVAPMHVQSDAHAGLGERRAARELREEAFDIVARRLGEDDPALLEHLESLADWYASRGLTVRERRSREQMLALQRQHYPDEPMLQVDTLLRIAESWKGEVAAAMRHPMDRRSALQIARLRPAASSGARPSRDALQRAQQVLDAQPNPSAEARARMLAAWGDWHMIFDSGPDEALALYQEAWEVLDGHDTLRQQWFGRATPLYLVPPPYPPGGQRPDARIGTVTLRFSIGSDGRAHDIEVEEPSPEDTMTDATIAQLERTGRYRPRMEAGQPVTTPGARLRQSFRYRADD